MGAGFIVRDCQLVAYAEAGFRVVGITSRTLEHAQEVARLRHVPRVFATVEEMLDDPSIEVVDVAVPPRSPAGTDRSSSLSSAQGPGHLAQKPLAFTLAEARRLVDACARAGVVLQVNQNMRYDHSVRALSRLIDRGVLGDPVLATIEMRAIPHWMPWASEGRSLSTFVMSIHHLDTFRYWLGDPARVLASTRPDPRTGFPHEDGINLYILEFDSGAGLRRGTTSGVVPREGAAADLGIRWRFEGTEGLAVGTIGWPGWPERVPSTLDYSTRADQGRWHRPRWPEAWFPDAFAGTMAGLLRALRPEPSPISPGGTISAPSLSARRFWLPRSKSRVVRLDEFRP